MNRWTTALMVAGMFVAGCGFAGSVAVHQDDLASPEWRQAIAAATNHLADHRERLLTRANVPEAGVSNYLHYSLARVILVAPQAGETVRAEITKIKELNPAYDGGGSLFQMTGDRQFVFVEHINSAQRSNGQDPLILTSPRRGTNTVWVPVPMDGELGIVGDVVLSGED